MGRSWSAAIPWNNPGMVSSSPSVVRIGPEMPHIIYQTGLPKTPYRGGKSEPDATEFYLKHFANSVYLQHVANHDTDWEMRHQAAKEMLIAEKKMDHWKRHSNFNLQLAVELSGLIKKQLCHHNLVKV